MYFQSKNTDDKQADSERYFNIDIEKVYILNMLFIWGGYLVGNQTE
ncbi:uracil phosphoribosyltransferase [Moritella sp. 24]|nr:uracil phosphoribosyltransferase [Moritella sp. 24]QUM75421.1 uracil phosphoribosyltransferase [Moritella sp. 24]